VKRIALLGNDWVIRRSQYLESDHLEEWNKKVLSPFVKKAFQQFKHRTDRTKINSVNFEPMLTIQALRNS
jgi:hypothetical protein